MKKSAAAHAADPAGCRAEMPGTSPLQAAVHRAFHLPAANVELLDLVGDIRRTSMHGQRIVAKRRTGTAGLAEQRKASEAHRRLAGLVVDGFAVRPVVPDIVDLGPALSALVSRDLGEPLGHHSVDDCRLSPHVVEDLLRAVLRRGVEHSGLIPRNLFLREGALWVIDWEDAEFDPPPDGPSIVTVTKWDVAWGDYFRSDIGLRHRIEPRAEADPVLDGFEQALGRVMADGVDAGVLRQVGAEATLLSESFVAGLVGRSAAVLGHLADDVLPSELSVFHTMLTARLRAECGDAHYATVLTAVDHAVRAAGADAAVAWIQTLCQTCDQVLRAASQRTVPGRPLVEAAQSWQALRRSGGWDTGRARAGAAEHLLATVSNLVCFALHLDDLQLLLRGSLSQGLIGLRSDVDFELSSPRVPRGHHGAEGLIVGILAAFGVPAEGSEGRPSERDVAAGGISRDLHEWLELRPAFSAFQDAGWVAEVLGAPSRDVVNRPSEYERQGRVMTAKYLWFEARAALARLACRCAAPAAGMPALIDDQLALIASSIGERPASEMRQVIGQAFRLREQEAADPEELRLLAGGIDRLREALGLAGPRTDQGVGAER